VSEDLTVPVRVDLPASQFRALDRLSKAHGTTVRSLVRECVRRQLLGETKPEDPRDLRIREMHAQGLSDNKIGQQLGMAHSTVSARRNRMGLPAHFSGRPRRDQGVAA
jgi:DNA-binding NarL/FixJ family response regulator